MSHSRSLAINETWGSHQSRVDCGEASLWLIRDGFSELDLLTADRWLSQTTRRQLPAVRLCS